MRWIIGVAAVVLVLGAGLVYLQVQAQRSGGTEVRSTDCSPQPCANASGYVMRLTDVAVNGNDVRVQVSFTVHGLSSMRAAPFDFRLVDGADRRLAPSFDGAGCPSWEPTPVPDGGSFGPVTLCFRTVAGGGSLKLHWSPQLGLNASTGYDFPIH